jgi:NADPH:quinone reductase-like Zn-dependent oxidoreductase
VEVEAMKAVVQHRYGPPDVLRIEEVERPIPGEHDVLIHVRATTVSQSDTHARGAHPFAWRFVAGLRRPRWRCLGVEFAGVVEAIGGAVTEFRAGDEVFGQPSRFFGAHAEYIVLSESAPVSAKPANLPFDEAAAVGDGSSQALDALRQAKVGPGSNIVIYGASGSLGTAAVQIAKHLGARVTGVCGPTHLELVRSLGADEVVDYTLADFRSAGPVYDAVIDAVGKYAFVRARRALRPGGIYVATDAGPYLESLLMAIPSRFAGSRRLVFAVGRRSKQNLVFMRELIESGAYRPVIDRRYPLDQVVDAHRRVESWHKAGNVVLVMP